MKAQIAPRILSATLESNQGKEISAVVLPEVDRGLPSAVMSVTPTHHRRRPDLQLERLPELRGQLNAGAWDLLARKFDLCTQICDFSDLETDLVAKTVKERTLEELDKFFEDEKMLKWPEMLNDRFFAMVMANLFRSIPVTRRELLGLGEEPVIMEVAWPHLTWVYSILLKFQRVNPRCTQFNLAFLRKVALNLNAPDRRERFRVVEFLTQYIQTHLDNFPALLRIFVSLIFDYLAGNGPPFSVGHILGFCVRQSDVTTKDSYFNNIKVLEEKCLYGLLSAPHFVNFQSSLLAFITVLMDRNPDKRSHYIRMICSRWPAAYPAKQPSFLSLLIAVLERSTIDCLPRVFRIIRQCYLSPDVATLEASLNLWNNPRLLPMIITHAEYLFPLVLPAMAWCSKTHWSPRIQAIARKCLCTASARCPRIFRMVADEYKPVRKNSWSVIAKTATFHDPAVHVSAFVRKIPKSETEEMIALGIQVMKEYLVGNDDPDIPLCGMQVAARSRRNSGIRIPMGLIKSRILLASRSAPERVTKVGEENLSIEQPCFSFE
jgi:hypothetical protein